MKGKQKIYEKGITLIALVITIIILLILAGVTISIVFNEGIAEKSQTAVDKYSEEAAKEKLEIALLDYKMGELSKEGKDLNYYLAKIGGTATEVEGENKYKVKLEGYEFTVNGNTYAICNPASWTWSDANNNETYDIGEVVAYGEEQFNIIDSDSTTVTLLAAKNIDTTNLEQSNSAPTVAFSTSVGWNAGENLNEYGSLKTDKVSAVYYAVEYGKKLGVTGRLMTKQELEKIHDGGTTELGYEDLSSWAPKWILATNYWLGSTSCPAFVWIMNREGRFSDYEFNSASHFGVRPVITVSKELIS